jgi:hypothetical protein
MKPDLVFLSDYHWIKQGKEFRLWWVGTADIPCNGAVVHRIGTQGDVSACETTPQHFNFFGISEIRPATEEEIANPALKPFEYEGYPSWTEMLDNW